MIDRFDKRKRDVLSKLDKSHKGEWDEKIAELCDSINSFDSYYTTSSCSGRIVLMIEQDKKDKGLFLSVYHDKISFKKLKEDLNEIIKPHHHYHNHPTKEKVNTKLKHPNFQNIKFKLEPCILHIACKTLEDSQKIYEKAKLAGWKKSGIIGMKSGFVVELNGTDRLEFPIINANKILVSDEFLEIVVEESNKKLEKSWIKIKRLEKLLK